MFRVCVFEKTLNSFKAEDSFGLTSSPPLHLPGGGGVRALVKKESAFSE